MIKEILKMLGLIIIGYTGGYLIKERITDWAVILLLAFFCYACIVNGEINGLKDEIRKINKCGS